MAKNGNGGKNARNSLVAATFEKANTYIFAAPIIRDREVGGSNPLAPTIIFKHLRLPAKVAGFVLWQDCADTQSYRRPFRSIRRVSVASPLLGTRARLSQISGIFSA